MGEKKEKTKCEQLNKIVNWLIVQKVKSFSFKDLLCKFQDIDLKQMGLLTKRMLEMDIIKYNKIRGAYSVNY